MAKTAKKTDAVPGGSVRITAKKAGFRRAGMEHAAEAVIHPPGTFTEEQIEALEAEPMLVVDRLGDAPAEKVES